MPKLNSLKSKALGKLHEYTPVVFELEVTADATGGITYSLPYEIKIVDIIARSTATVASATVRVSDGTNNITDVLDVDTVDVRDTPATIDTTYSTVSSVKLTTVGATARCLVYIYGLRV